MADNASIIVGLARFLVVGSRLLWFRDHFNATIIEDSSPDDVVNF